MRKKIVAIIPARENSKRIPRKNYKNFNGKPIIANTIEKLKESEKSIDAQFGKAVGRLKTFNDPRFAELTVDEINSLDASMASA